MILPNALYDKAKWFVTIVLPAFQVAYLGLAELYEWDNGTKVVGTTAIITAFLGVTLGISSKQYNESDRPYDGELNIFERPEGPVTYDLALDDMAESLQNKDKIVFKVNRDPLKGLEPAFVEDDEVPS